MPAGTILVIDADDASARLISDTLSKVGYTVTVSANPDEAFPLVAAHQLVVVDVIVGERTGLDVCREIRSTPALASIPILCVGQTDDVEERIHFLEAGADDVMGRPFDARELEARVEALLLRFQRSKDLVAVISTDAHRHPGTTDDRGPQPEGRRGHVTVATNIAMAPPASPTGWSSSTFDLQFGQVATYLNVEPPDARRRRPRRGRCVSRSFWTYRRHDGGCTC